jgi:uncharacterized protein (TIGR02646 family)
MRYIRKSIKPPLDFEQWKESKQAEIEEKCTAYEISKTKANNKEHLSSDIVWNLLPSSPAKEGYDFSKVKLRALLLEEQGYLCAYCGSLIENNPHVRGDHVTPKSLAIRRTFDYYNLVAACSGGEYIWHTINKSETLNSIAEKYATTVQFIKNLNPHLNFEENESIEVHIGTDKEIAINTIFPHCDVKKADSEHAIKPTDSDCQAKFSYSIDGKTLAVGEDAKMTIDVLGLNDNPFLIEKRHSIYLRFSQIFKIIAAPNIPKEQKKAISIKERDKTNGNRLEEMVFVKEFFWKTLPM